jgi:predicted DCC family thiol-disulfide oxidoreductase YuxK
MRLTVLYDSGCPLCGYFRGWLAAQPKLIPLELVPAESAEARARFPTLDHGRTMQEITVVGDDGSVWTGASAWVMCLWALGEYRPLAERLATPHGMTMARAMALSAAGLRHLLARPPLTTPLATPLAKGGDYPDRCAGPACEATPVAHVEG